MKESVATKNRAGVAWLAAAFEKEPRLSASGDFLQAYRQQQFAQFQQRGLPSRREENWKYTDLSFLEKQDFHWPPVDLQSLRLTAELQTLLVERARESLLLVFVNGHYASQLSAISPLPEGVILSNLQQSLQIHASLLRTYLLKERDAQRHPFASLNAAFFSDGLFLYVPRSIILEKPIHILSLALGNEGSMAHTRHVVILENEAQLSLTEEYRSEGVDQYFTNVTLDCFVGREARMNYYKVQNEAKAAKHLATVFFHQKQNSIVNACSVALGGQFSRNEVQVILQEPYAACRLNGFYGLDMDGQVIDNHLEVEHAAPHTHSAMDYRGILAKQSRAIFNGKVQVRPQAKKTQAQQINHNLLLSPLAEVDTKPELEIDADEVQCRHGATVGQLNEESLFYLGARGVDRHTATIILLQAFVTAVLSEITLPGVVQLVQQLWGGRVAKL